MKRDMELVRKMLLEIEYSLRYSGSPASTRPTSTNMTALKCSLRRMPSAPVQESARASSKVSSSGRGGRSTRFSVRSR